MLLDRIDEKTIASLKEKYGSEGELSAEKYDIYDQYDTAAGLMIYLAVRKDQCDESIPLGYYFSIGADQKIRRSTSFPFFPLLMYLRSYEKTLSEEQQKELYGDAYYTLGAVVGLTAEELAERENTRRAFLALLDSLNDKGALKAKSAGEQLLDLRLELLGLPEKARPMEFRLKIGDQGGKLYYVPNAHVFCQALKAGSELNIRSFSRSLMPEAFDESWRPLMERFLGLVRLSTASGKQQVFLVPRANLPAFFSLLPEKTAGEVLISDAGSWTFTRSAETASVSLDSAGALILSPKAPKARTETVIVDRKMICLSPQTREAVLYQFEDNINAELYSFFLNRKKKDFEYVSDLFVQKVLPAASGMIRKSEKNTFRITVHIALEDSALQFRTEYWMGEEKKNLSLFEDKPFEQALIRSCGSVLQTLHGTENGRVTDPDDVLFFLKSDLAPLRQVATVYLDERLKRLNIRKAPAVQIQARRSGGWLNLTFHSSEFSEKELEEIYAAYRRKKSYFLLKDNLILLEPESMEPVETVIEEAGAEKSLRNVRLPFYHAMLLDGYREAGADISTDRDIRAAVTDVVGYRDAELALNKRLNQILRPYQADGVRWMMQLSRHGFSGVLADDMGLGKTLEVLAFLSMSDFDRPVLIVCPKSLVYNWKNEIRKWLGECDVVIITGSKSTRVEMINAIPEQRRIFYITGYDSLRADVDAYEKKHFFLLLADEAQNIKNASTQKAKAIRKIESDMRMALTGTPVENSLTDLWSIFDFLMPGYLGTEARFRKQYESDGAPEDAHRILAKKVAPFLLRRSKEEVLDSLPGKEVVLVTVSMADEQRKIYEAYLHKARQLSQTEKGVSVFSALTRLRQICVDPSVFLEEYNETSAKLSVALDQVNASIEGGHRVLVFSSFTRVLEHFRYMLEERDIRSYYISGDTPGALRVEMAEKFNQEDRVKVMLISIKAGGTGLNLIGADIVIHLDPWWNFAVEEQATDRAYRIGQTRPVTVYKLVAHDSIEEKVIALQEQKKQASADVVQTDLSGIDAFSAEDIRYILQE